MTTQELVVDHARHETFDRLLLNRPEDSELEILESHIPACNVCLDRIENLNLQITTTEVALKNLQIKQAASSWKHRVDRLSAFLRLMPSKAVPTQSPVAIRLGKELRLRTAEKYAQADEKA